MVERILIISKVCTHPLEMGNSKAILAQATILQELGCEVDFLYVQEIGFGAGQQSKAAQSYSQTKDYWDNHFLYLRVGKVEKFLKNLLALFRKYLCREHEGTYDKYPWKLTSFVKRIQQAEKYDICLVQYYYLTKLFKTVKFDKMVCFTHDVFAYKNQIIGEQCPWIDADQEARAMQLCTDILAIQEEEKNYYHGLSPQNRLYNVYTPYIYHETEYKGNKNILFLSGNNGFNQNGLKWFVKEVLPLIRENYKDSKLIVAGGICKVIKGLYEDNEGIVILGFVNDPIDLYKLGDVVINPVYQGTGLKIKTFESISYGKVTLVHPHSEAGIYKKDSAPLFVSDKPSDWVNYLEKVFCNQVEIERIKKQDKEYIESMNSFIKNEYQRLISAQ